MKRTTLKLDDVILRQLKQRAASEGRTLQDVTNDLLRRALATNERDRARYVLTLRGWKAAEQPGVDLLDRDTMFDLMDGR